MTTGALAGRVPENDREARIAWGRISEPCDRRAAALGVARDPLSALDVVLHGAQPEHDRFRVRLRGLDIDHELHVLSALGARVIVPGDEQWPSGLDDLDDPPVCLWARGPADLAAAARRSVAIVGARAATPYGTHVAAELAGGLGERGFTIVSGAAYGIDAAAHHGALVCSAPTVAVLAGGVDRPYPAGNADLLARIHEQGLVVSETAPGCAPTKPRFLSRNRLIAAIASGTVVVEAGWRSGSLSTARHAARILRPVAMVPGPVTSALSAGTNEAIRSMLGVCVTDADEVAELVGAMGADLAPVREGPTLFGDDLEPDEQRVLSALPVHRGVAVDRVCAAAGLSALEVTRALGRLALLGVAVCGPDGGWRVAPHR